MENNLSDKELARMARNKYYRDYYKRPENKEKKKEYNAKYWKRKGEELLNEL